MSSLRPATIVASLFQMLEEALSAPVEAVGPSCSCLRCEEAWNRNHSPNRMLPRADIGLGLRRVNPG
jgi:hypothetical protein